MLKRSPQMFDPIRVKPTSELLPLLRSWDGRGCGSHLVFFSGTRWIVKSLASSAETFREIMASRIGEGIVNIARVVPAKASLDFRPGSAHVIFSRLAYDYSIQNLPLRNLDAAAAGELVFSTILRRRDAHEFNRSYVDGLPVFYDHNVAFGGDAGFEQIEVFFARSDDEGYAGRWRGCRVDSSSEVKLKFRDMNWGARHFYLSEKRVRRFALKVTALLLRRMEKAAELIKHCEFDAAEQARISGFLHLARSAAYHDVQFMLDRVFDTPAWQPRLADSRVLMPAAAC